MIGRLIQEEKKVLMKTSLVRSLPILVGILLQVSNCPAQVCRTNELQKVIAADGDTFDLFGSFNQVSLEGDRLVVGASQEDGACPGDPNCNSGSVYVYGFNGTSWVQSAKITASDAEAGDQFGSSAAVSGDVLVVGAWLADTNGVVYIYRLSGASWVEEARLVRPVGSSGSGFGTAVATTGDRVLVGAPGSISEAFIYAYDGSTWNLEATLPTSRTSNRFGNSVAIVDDLAIVGAPSDEPRPEGPVGAAFVYRFSGGTWMEEVKLVPSDPVYSEFGRGVSIHGNVAIAGAPSAASGQAAYVFRFDGASWIEEDILLPDSLGQQFGGSVGIRGDVAVVGAHTDPEVGPSAGSAYIFRFHGSHWYREVKVTAQVPSSPAQLGTGVSISGGRVAIGASEATGNEPESGAIYVFGGLSDCNDNDVIDTCDIVAGDLTDADFDGSPDACDGTGPGGGCVLVNSTCIAPFSEAFCINSGGVFLGEGVLCAAPNLSDVPALSGFSLVIMFLLICGAGAVLSRRTISSGTPSSE